MSSSLITGIDIGHYSIKVVVLKSVRTHFAIISYQELVIDTIFTDNPKVDYPKIVKKLKELKKDLSFFRQKVAISVPNHAVINKVITLKQQQNAQQQALIIKRTFAEQAFLAADDLSFDFIFINDNEIEQTASYQVYATRKEEVEYRVNAAVEAGFTPVVVDVQLHALHHIWQSFLNYHPELQSSLLIDIGFTQTSFCLHLFNQSPFGKSIAYGVKEINAAPTVALGVTELIQKIEQSMAFVFSEFNFKENIASALEGSNSFNIEGIYLSGGGACLPKLVEQFKAQWRINGEMIRCECFNPFSLLDNKKFVLPKEESHNSQFSIAAGIAIGALKWQRQKQNYK